MRLVTGTRPANAMRIVDIIPLLAPGVRGAGVRSPGVRSPGVRLSSEQKASNEEPPRRKLDVAHVDIIFGISVFCFKIVRVQDPGMISAPTWNRRMCVWLAPRLPDAVQQLQRLRVMIVDPRHRHGRITLHQ